MNAQNVFDTLIMTCRNALVTLASVSLLTGCVTSALAPGADKVHLTTDARDVTACTAVGNVIGVQSNNPLRDNAISEMRNQTIGLGGNTVFVTDGELGEGVAYRCP